MRLFLCLFVALLVNYNEAFVSVRVEHRTNDTFEGCVHNGAQHSYGQEWYEDECMKLSCNKLNESSNIISTLGCGVVNTTDLGPNCKVESPPRDKVYPDCCIPVIHCL